MPVRAISATAKAVVSNSRSDPADRLMLLEWSWCIHFGVQEAGFSLL